MCGISKGCCGTNDMEQAQHQKKKEEGCNGRKMGGKRCPGKRGPFAGCDFTRLCPKQRTHTLLLMNVIRSEPPPPPQGDPSVLDAKYPAPHQLPAGGPLGRGGAGRGGGSRRGAGEGGYLGGGVSGTSDGGW